jgi:D-sedoheptulose 7-phosphate isomerase
MEELVRQEIATTLMLYQRFLEDKEAIAAVAGIGAACGAALARGNKILLAGNGGSAADSQHIAAEFVSRLVTDRQPLPAIALTTDSSILTAAANDYGFEVVFSRQIKALGRPGDIFIGISTSGNSLNILSALASARQCGMTTAGLTGNGSTKMASWCDHLVRVPSCRTQNIQEVHIMVGHTICAIAEKGFLPLGKYEVTGAGASGEP